MLELIVQLASEFLKFFLCGNYWHNDVGDDVLFFALKSHYPILLKMSSNRNAFSLISAELNLYPSASDMGRSISSNSRVWKD